MAYRQWDKEKQKLVYGGEAVDYRSLAFQLAVTVQELAPLTSGHRLARIRRLLEKAKAGGLIE